MRTGTGVIEEVCADGLVKIQTNRSNLYSPCSDSMCADNVVIDAVKAAPEMTAFAGMIIGGIIGCLILKGYEKKINNNQNKATITGIIA